MKKKNRIWICLLLVLAGCLGINSGQAEAAKKTTKKKAVYTMKNYREIHQGGGDTVAKYAYDLPQLKGNTKVVKKINKSLKKGYTQSLKDKKRCFNYADYGDAWNEDAEYFTQRALLWCW